MQPRDRGFEDRIIDLPSPNQRDRPDNVTIDTLILHYTGMQSGAEAIARLRDPQAAVSSHYVVEEDGQIFRLVEEFRRAAHAGISVWQGREMLNDSSIGIEIVNPGHQWGYRSFPDAQIDAVRRLCHAIMSRHPIPSARVLGHSDVAPERKEDPGELFPWEALAREGIGVWPSGVADTGRDQPVVDEEALAPVRRALRSVGYAIEEKGGMDDRLAIVLRAFQRHWRPEAVTGAADIGSRARLFALTAKLAG